MIRIALDLCWPAFVALDDEARRIAVDRHRRGVMQRIARNDLGRRVDVRQDLSIRGAHASAKTSQGGACPEQCDEVAARERIWWDGDALGKFASIVTRHDALPMTGRTVRQRPHTVTCHERGA
jgi:hypothetical protein